MNRSLSPALALAGIVQSAFIVRQLAQHGVAAGDKFGVAVDSLFVFDPHTALDVYGSVSNLNQGLQVLQELLEGNSRDSASAEILKYTLGMLYLQGKLMRAPGMLGKIRTGLDSIAARHPDGKLCDDPHTIAALARLYQETISTLSYRIQVKGNILRLQNEHLAAKIRVVLLSGIRSAVLWDQCGGRRWHLVFRRKHLRSQVKELLNHAV